MDYSFAHLRLLPFSAPLRGGPFVLTALVPLWKRGGEPFAIEEVSSGLYPTGVQVAVSISAAPGISWIRVVPRTHSDHIISIDNTVR